MAIFLQPSFWKELFNFKNRKNWLNLDEHILKVASDNSFAGLDSPDFTGIPTAPYVFPPTSQSNQIANCAFVQNAILAAGSSITTKFSLTNSQLTNLYTTPVLIPNMQAPGPGKALRVLNMSFRYNYSGGSHTMSSGGIAILPTSKAGSLPTTATSQYIIDYRAISTGATTNTGLAISALATGSPFVLGEYQALVENDTLSLRASAAISGSNSSTLDLYITYTVITF